MLRTDLYKVLQSKTERRIEITCYVFKNEKNEMGGSDDSTTKQAHAITKLCP